MKPPSPLLGFNNNVRHKGRVFHIQTEDSGVRHPHVITHLFADGGRILKTTKTSYAEFIDAPNMAEVVRQMMQDQHKAMFMALRDGQFDPLIEEVVGKGSPGGAKAASPAAAPTAAPTMASAEASPRDRPAEAARPAVSPPKGPEATPTIVARAPDPPRGGGDRTVAVVEGRATSEAPVAARPPAPAIAEVRVERSADRDAAARAHPLGSAPTQPAVPIVFSDAVLPPRVNVIAAPPAGAPQAVAPKTAAPQAAPPKTAAPQAVAPKAVAPQAAPPLVIAPAATTIAQQPSLPPQRPTPPRMPSARPRLDIDPAAIHRAPLPSAAPQGGTLASIVEASVDTGSGIDLGTLERAAAEAETPLFQQIRDLPPPPAAVLGSRAAAAGGGYSSVTAPAPAPPPPPSTRGRYAPSRPSSIFAAVRPQEGASIFGEDLISEKSLDEVILSYLAEDLDGPGEKK